MTAYRFDDGRLELVPWKGDHYITRGPVEETDPVIHGEYDWLTRTSRPIARSVVWRALPFRSASHGDVVVYIREDRPVTYDELVVAFYQLAEQRRPEPLRCSRCRANAYVVMSASSIEFRERTFQVRCGCGSLHLTVSETVLEAGFETERAIVQRLLDRARGGPGMTCQKCLYGWPFSFHDTRFPCNSCGAPATRGPTVEAWYYTEGLDPDGDPCTTVVHAESVLDPTSIYDDALIRLDELLYSGVRVRLVVLQVEWAFGNGPFARYRVRQTLDVPLPPADALPN
ncbi:MAG: hypothetical protein HOW73_43440 [Polyangiaceae bacterium]|nr:hypothetical protein [Polyangiaceae bacterium]